MYLTQRFSIIHVFKHVVRDNHVDAIIRQRDGLHIKRLVGDSWVQVCGAIFVCWQHC